MADTAATSPARHWWAVKRIQGLVIMGVGFAMLAFPVTAPHAGTVIGVGAAWAGIGEIAKIERDAKAAEQPQPTPWVR